MSKLYRTVTRQNVSGGVRVLFSGPAKAIVWKDESNTWNWKSHAGCWVERSIPSLGTDAVKFREDHELLEEDKLRAAFVFDDPLGRPLEVGKGADDRVWYFRGQLLSRKPDLECQWFDLDE